jgi:hypothetical protein
MEIFLHVFQAFQMAGLYVLTEGTAIAIRVRGKVDLRDKGRIVSSETGIG